ncbi:MAG: N-acetylmuramoyl-L-alanine amidase [Clostridium sp.]
MKKFIVCIMLGLIIIIGGDYRLTDATETKKIVNEADDKELISFDEFIKKYRGNIPNEEIVSKEKVRNYNIEIINKNLTWNGELDLTNKPKKLVMHHIEASRDNGNIRVEEINEWHKGNGWSGIGYHFYINKKGEIYRGRPEEAIGAHALYNNVDTLGIAVEGRYQFETMPSKQKEAVILLGKYLRNKYQINIINKHGDLVSTDCPGKKYPYEEIKKQILLEPIKEVYRVEKRDNRIFFVDTWTNEVQHGNITYKGKTYLADKIYGIKQNGWIELENNWYYLNENFTTAVGWKQLGEKWYYLNWEGKMQKGWQLLGENWYYFDNFGGMVTGWLQLGSEWYYLEGSGRMITGWKFLGVDWYYFEGSGQMAKGWKYLGVDWYYFNESGKMESEWKYISGNWYYFNESGKRVQGWLFDKNTWYYLAEDGKMVTGWLDINGHRYYLDQWGAMVTGKQIIDGKEYFFSEWGYLER